MGQKIYRLGINCREGLSDGELVEIGGNVAWHNCSDSDLGENVKMMDEAEIQKIAQEAVERAKKAAEEGYLNSVLMDSLIISSRAKSY